MNEKVVMVSNDYDRIDGRNAYQSDIKRLTLGAPMLEENKKMQIAAQIWKNDKDGELILAQELPIHQIFDDFFVQDIALLQGGLSTPPFI